MGNFLPPVRVLYGEVEGIRVDIFHVYAPAFRRVGLSLLQFDELGEVGVVEWVGLPHVAARVKLVEPDLPRLPPLLEEEHHRLHPRANKRAAGAVEHGVEVALFQQLLAQADRGVVRVGEEGILDNNPRSATSLENFDEVLQEEESGFAGADREVLLYLLPLLAAEGWVGEDDVEAILLLHVGQVLGERVGVDDVWSLDAVQDHIHDRDHVGEGLLFLPVEGSCLQGAILCGSPPQILFPQVLEAFAEEASRADGGVADRLAELRRGDGNDGANQGTRGVILTPVPPGVPHVLDLCFVEVGEFVLFRLGLESEFVDVVDSLPQVVATLDAVLDLAEDFADFVLDGVRAAGLLLETLQVGKELAVYEGNQVISGLGGVVVDHPETILRRGPRFPAVGFVQDVGILFPFEGGYSRLVLFESVEIFQEEEPGGLLGVIKFAGATSIFPENVVDVLECLFKHVCIFLIESQRPSYAP